MTKSKKLVLGQNKFIVLVIMLAFSTTIPDVFASADVQWNDLLVPTTQYEITAGNPGSPVKIMAEDTDLAGNSISDQITVHITSTVDTTGIDLTLTEDADTGTFTNNHLVFLTDVADKFQIGDTITITVEDKCTVPGHGNCNAAVVETLSTAFGVIVRSDSDLAGITLDLIETGANTGLFTTKVKFTTGPSDANPSPQVSEIQVSAGDAISVTDQVTSKRTNGFILPISGGNGAIAVEIADPGASVTYGSAGPNSVEIVTDGAPGRGGGGLVRPGLVVDAVASAAITSSGGGNGCKGDCTPPTLGVDKTYKRLVDGGFSYNDHPVDVELYYTHYPLVTAIIGNENSAVLKIYDNSGPANIEHVGLAFGLGSGEIFSDSKAAINLDRDSHDQFSVTEDDPENALDDIHIRTDHDKCSAFITAECLVVTIYHTFRTPLDFNMVSTEIWDRDRNFWQNYYNDGVKVDGESLNPPRQHVGIYKGKQIAITEIDKNSAVDEHGEYWTFDKEWTKDYIKQEKIDKGPTSHGFDRNSVQFQKILIEEQDIAKIKMEELTSGKTIVDIPTQIDIKVWKYVSRSDDVELQKRIRVEQMKAEKWILEQSAMINRMSP